MVFSKDSKHYPAKRLRYRSSFMYVMAGVITHHSILKLKMGKTSFVPSDIPYAVSGRSLNADSRDQLARNTCRSSGGRNSVMLQSISHQDFPYYFFHQKALIHLRDFYFFFIETHPLSEAFLENDSQTQGRISGQALCKQPLVLHWRD